MASIIDNATCSSPCYLKHEDMGCLDSQHDRSTAYIFLLHPSLHRHHITTLTYDCKVLPFSTACKPSVAKVHKKVCKCCKSFDCEPLLCFPFCSQPLAEATNSTFKATITLSLPYPRYTSTPESVSECCRKTNVILVCLQQSVTILKHDA